jgi:hypothetical protein
MTDRRLLLLDGFLVHRVAMMPSEKVTDLGYERTPLGQLLGYGTFVLETAGQDQALDRVTWVPRPDARYRLIIAALFHPDAADAEAAAQSASLESRVQPLPSTDSPSPPPPALMPRIGRRSNPPTQRIELPPARGGATPGSTSGGAANEPVGPGGTTPERGEPTGATWPSAGGGATPTTPAGDTPTSRASGGGRGEHVPGGPTATPDAGEVLPKPFIEGGKDPKIR